MTEREYRVWCENGDLILVTDSKDDAERELEDCILNCPCGGDEEGCETSSHGYHIQVIVDGYDVTGDY